MKFKNLMCLDSDDAGNVLFNELIALLPNTPSDVLEQFYVDHGRNGHFQNQYHNLDISNLKWSIHELGFIELSNISIYADFQHWVNVCETKSKKVIENNEWSQIGHLKKTVTHWESNHTWLRYPILLKSNNKYHLVEGHSRIGCLKGLVKSGTISKNKKHKVWVGELKR